MAPPSPTPSPARTAGKGLGELYRRAGEVAVQGDHTEARRLLLLCRQSPADPAFHSLLENDLATLDALAGNYTEAARGFERALAIDPDCQSARDNLTLLHEDLAQEQPRPGPPPATPQSPPAPPAVKVAVVSLLFNFPSAGGGNIHTAELVRFLSLAGFNVRHFYARFDPWQIGRVPIPLEHSQALDFDDNSWNLPSIQGRFRQAVDAFAPDYVLVTDAWNCKPHLALALRGYPVLLRFQALECLCPLNNVRLLPPENGRWVQCPRHQLATPDVCASCLRDRGQSSGGLHQAERDLAGVGTPGYHALLLEALRQAEAVLVLNPLTEAMLSPYAPRVRVVPWGMDPARFPWTPDAANPVERPRKVLFQAGVLEEPMKGFAVLHAACQRLWQKRQDFELVGTGEPAGQVDAFTRYLGWVSQEELPRHYRDADVVVVPTVAQEGLSRTSVEAMAAGRPVVASRIGGLPATVVDGATGLLCEPGDAEDLARKLETLLDDTGLRQQMGVAGRRRFEEHFSWPVVIERFYRPLLPKRAVPGK